MTKIHYRLAKDTTDVLSKIERAINAGVDFVHLASNHLSTDFFDQLKKQNIPTEKLVLLNEPEKARELGLKNVFISNGSIDVFELKSNYPNLNFGATAYSLADCKNLELAGADYIEMIVPSKKQNSIPLGSELMQDIIPKEESYGWVVMSLNTPVLASGIPTIKKFEKLQDSADVKGIVISETFEPNSTLESIVSYLTQAQS